MCLQMANPIFQSTFTGQHGVSEGYLKMAKGVPQGYDGCLC